MGKGFWQGASVTRAPPRPSPVRPPEPSCWRSACSVPPSGCRTTRTCRCRARKSRPRSGRHSCPTPSSGRGPETHCKTQPDDWLAEVAGHLAHYRQLPRGSLEGWGHFLLKALPPGLFPRHGGCRVEEFEPAGVVISHPADELVEDVEPVDPEREDGPAQRRPVAEDVVGLAPLPRCQAD